MMRSNNKKQTYTVAIQTDPALSPCDAIVEGRKKLQNIINDSIIHPCEIKDVNINNTDNVKIEITVPSHVELAQIEHASPAVKDVSI